MNQGRTRSPDETTIFVDGLAKTNECGTGNSVVPYHMSRFEPWTLTRSTLRFSLPLVEGAAEVDSAGWRFDDCSIGHKN